MAPEKQRSSPFQARIGESDWTEVSGGGQDGVIPCLVGGIQKGQRPIQGPSAPFPFLFPPRVPRGLGTPAWGAGEECSTTRSMRDRVVCNPGISRGAYAKRRRGPGMLPDSTSPLFLDVAVGLIWTRACTCTRTSVRYGQGALTLIWSAFERETVRSGASRGLQNETRAHFRL